MAEGVRTYEIHFAAGYSERMECSEEPIIDGPTVTFVMQGYTRYYPNRRVTYVLSGLISWEVIK